MSRADLSVWRRGADSNRRIEVLQRPTGHVPPSLSHSLSIAQPRIRSGFDAILTSPACEFELVQVSENERYNLDFTWIFAGPAPAPLAGCPNGHLRGSMDTRMDTNTSLVASSGFQNDAQI